MCKCIFGQDLRTIHFLNVIFIELIQLITIISHENILYKRDIK